jgi:beta-galactosidase
MLRKYQPQGPLVNAEYYPGWLTHWQEDMQRVATEPVLHSLKDMLSKGASVNFYMFFGGTNFGFTAGANDGGPGRYNVDVTSYDYDAPLDEAGDPTQKFYDIRNTIGQFFPLPSVPLPVKEPKMSLPELSLKPLTTMLSAYARSKLTRPSVENPDPLSFEALNQHSGFVLYETEIPKTFKRDPLQLKIEKLRDRAYIYVDRVSDILNWWIMCVLISFISEFHRGFVP